MALSVAMMVLHVICFNNFVWRSWQSIFNHLNVKYIHRGWKVSVHYHKRILQDKNGLQKIINYTNPWQKDTVDGVTHELTLQDVEHDPNWITTSTCIVTSNVDRATVNAEAAKAFGKCNNVCILHWKRKLSLDFPLSVEAILYDKDWSSLLILYKEGAVRCWTVHMVMCTVVLQMVLHVQYIH